MNNDELIIKILSEIKNDMSGIKETINNIDKRTTRTELHLENVTDKNISLIMEQYTPNTHELKTNTENIEKLLFDVDNLKRVVISHSNEINRLTKNK
jgi:archaellum component FlaC